MLDEKQIKALQDKGAKRWSKGSMDRMYVDATLLGLDVTYYKTGNVQFAAWCGQKISNADGRRLLASKVYVDVKTGNLSVTTSFDCYDDTPTLSERAEAFVSEAFEGAGE